MNEREFIPETQEINLDIDFDLEDSSIVSHFPTDCQKPQNHAHYKFLRDLKITDLPPSWQHDWALRDLKLIGKRVVHITVLRKSVLRRNWRTEPSHEGSGFLTFDPKYGPLVHTSKHVVLNPYEAEHTIVRLFYEDDSAIKEMYRAIGWFKNNLIGNHHVGHHLATSSPMDRKDLVWESPKSGVYMYLADERYFKSVMCSDYTSFSVDWRVQAHFTKEDIEHSDHAFSWRMASLKRIVLGPQLNIDVGIVAHPHGMPKSVAFGKMKRLTGLHPALYDAPTCGGSSGSPVVRLHPDSLHYVSAGQFVHHGHYRRKLDLGMGTVRPPIAFPYIYKLDVETVWANALSVCYEPIFYWTLFACDLLHIESTLSSSLDVFAYTSTLSAFAFGVSSGLFRFLFTGYWLHIISSIILRMVVLGWSFVYAVSSSIATIISMSMFMVSWLLLFLAPYPLSSVPAVSLVWLVVLFLERHYNVRNRFSLWAMGSFPDHMQFILGKEEARLGQRERGNMDTIQPVDYHVNDAGHEKKN
ncbi:hypothetical protein PoB_000793500 [Plakobranchus ocellatus]|uniref:Transmembrane protein n=1 Tax=Plakobranchus ocellatus TaxID=259542 RepID=A0AAV3YG26_9GAST|nr:hypothetical protein PoB_000793500 [Plakobranchus ocellatus]